jgi:hypothetical protein
MISDAAIDSYGKALNFYHHLGYTPFLFDGKVKHKRLAKTCAFPFLLYLLNGTLQFVKAFYTMSRLVSVLLIQDMITSYSELFWLGIFAIAELWALPLFTSVWSHRKELPLFLNSMVNYSKEISKVNSESYLTKEFDVIRGIVILLIGFGNACIALLMGMFLLNPSQKQFVSSVCHPNGELNPFQLTTYFLVELYMKTGLQTSIILDNMLHFVMYFLFAPWAIHNVK